MRTLAVTLGVALSASGCANTYHPDYHPELQYAYTQSISSPVTIFQSGNQSTPANAQPPAPAALGGHGDPSRIIVLQGKHLDRNAQVVGVVDAHEEMGKHEAALWALKSKAAALGADAIVGVEFEHGEGEGQPTHLSGLAVRFSPSVPYPVD